MVLNHPDYEDRGVMVGDGNPNNIAKAVFNIIGRPSGGIPTLGEDDEQLTQGNANLNASSGASRTSVYIPEVGSPIDKTWVGYTLYRVVSTGGN